MMKKEAGFGGRDENLEIVPNISEFEERTSGGLDENTSEST